MNPTPGWQTTEFWKSVIVSLLGAVLAVLGYYKGDMTMLAIGLGAAGITSAAYSVSRGMAKSGDTNVTTSAPVTTGTATVTTTGDVAVHQAPPDGPSAAKIVAAVTAALSVPTPSTTAP